MSVSVVQTIQTARVGSPTACYRARSLDPLPCEVGTVLSFLQPLLDRGLFHVTTKAYTAGISSCHEGVGSRHVFSHPLMKHFLQGVRQQWPEASVSWHQWEFSLVLEVWVSDPYESLEHSSLWALSVKTVMLLVLTSAKRMGELTTLPVNPSCYCYLLLQGDHSGAVLRPNPSFDHKNLASSFRLRVIQLDFISLPSLHVNML